MNDLFSQPQETLMDTSQGLAELPSTADYQGEKSFVEAFWDAISGAVDSFAHLFDGVSKPEASEFNESMVERSARVMSEVFDDKTLSEWGSMTMQQREAKLDEYYSSLGQTLGITATDVVVEDLVAATGMEGVLGYNSHDGLIHIDYRNLQDPTQLVEILDTLTHEARHQLQGEAIADPSRFPEISPTLIEAWEINNKEGNYISPDWWPEGYYTQAVEVDARDFAAAVVNAFNNMRN